MGIGLGGSDMCVRFELFFSVKLLDKDGFVNL